MLNVLDDTTTRHKRNALYARHFIEMQNSTINLILLWFKNVIIKSAKLFS